MCYVQVAFNSLNVTELGVADLGFKLVSLVLGLCLSHIATLPTGRYRWYRLEDEGVQGRTQLPG